MMVIFFGVEKTYNGTVVKTITSMDIRSYESGFEITNGKNEIIEKQRIVETHFVEENVNNDETNVEIDDDDEVEKDDYDNTSDSESVAGTGGDIIGDISHEMNEQVYMESYKDIDRVTMVSKEFNSREMEYIKTIEKILGILLYCNDTINIYVMVPTILDIINKLKNNLEVENITTWKKSDEKYIIVMLVLYELAKTGKYNRSNELVHYMKVLYNNKFFTSNDISTSMFLRENVDKKDIKNLYKSKMYFEIIKIMLERCNQILENYCVKVDFSVNKFEIELIAVTPPHFVKEYPKYYLTPTDLVNGNYHETARIILWTPEYIGLIEKWKKMLLDKFNKEENPRVKILIGFVIENFDKAPMVLKSLENSIDELDILKYKEFKRIFERIVEQLKNMHKKITESKSEKLKEKIEAKEKLIIKRREIIKNINCYEDDNEDKMKSIENNIIKRMKRMRI